MVSEPIRVKDPQIDCLYVGANIAVDPRTVAWEMEPHDLNTPVRLVVDAVWSVPEMRFVHQRHVDTWGAENLLCGVRGLAEDGFYWQFLTIRDTSHIWCAT
ncbi:MAG: hypothetical protein KBD24_03685 [Candidatus Pacebacteria bacterium]|nr:hypothetical protein [Candidatus Paceibacterota bacterium]